jgi:hypothetical protein
VRPSLRRSLSQSLSRTLHRPLRRPAAAVGLAAAALALAGCFGLIRTNPGNLVLAPHDVPAGFVRTVAAPYTDAQVATAFGIPATTVANTLGRIDGYRAVYTSGPLSLESIVSLYRGAVPAEKALSIEVTANRQAHPGLTTLHVPTLGNQTQAFRGSVQDPTTKHTLAVVTIYWRQNNAIAALSLTGPPSAVSNATALAMAQAQERHMRAAA